MITQSLANLSKAIKLVFTPFIERDYCIDNPTSNRWLEQVNVKIKEGGMKALNLKSGTGVFKIKKTKQLRRQINCCNIRMYFHL